MHLIPFHTSHALAHCPRGFGLWELPTLWPAGFQDNFPQLCRNSTKATTCPWPGSSVGSEEP